MSDAGQGGSGGVTFLNNLNGALSLAGSGGINIIPQEDGTITIHSSGGVVTPGGPPSAIQYNNAGAFFGDSRFVRDPSTHYTDMGYLYTSGNGHTISNDFLLGGTFLTLPASGLASIDVAGAVTGFVGNLDLVPNGGSAINSVMGVSQTGVPNPWVGSCVVNALSASLQLTDNFGFNSKVLINTSSASLTYKNLSSNVTYGIYAEPSGLYMNLGNNLIPFPTSAGTVGQTIVKTNIGTTQWGFPNINYGQVIQSPRANAVLYTGSAGALSATPSRLFFDGVEFAVIDGSGHNFLQVNGGGPTQLGSSSSAYFSTNTSGVAAIRGTHINLSLNVYADDAAAGAAGLGTGDLYLTLIGGQNQVMSKI